MPDTNPDTEVEEKPKFIKKGPKVIEDKGYKCAPDGHTVVHFEKGAVLTGNAAKYYKADKATASVK